MIDLRSEEVLTLAEAAKVLPPLRGGRRVHLSTLYRWISRGVAGVQLEALKLGGTTVTSVEALQRFAERITFGAPSRPSDSARQDEVERELRRRGF